MFFRVFLIVTGLALSASGPALAGNDRHIEVRDRDGVEALHREHDGRRHDDEQGDPDKRPALQPGVSGSGPAPVSAGQTPDIVMPGKKTFDLAPLFGHHAKPAPRIVTPPKPMPQRAVATPSVSQAASGSSQSAALGEAAGPLAVPNAAIQKPPVTRSPVWPLAFLAAGVGVLAAAGHALKNLRGLRVRAEGVTGPGRVEKPEFDASAPPAIGFIVSPGKPVVSLTFDKTASGDAA